MTLKTRPTLSSPQRAVSSQEYSEAEALAMALTDSVMSEYGECVHPDDAARQVAHILSSGTELEPESDPLQLDMAFIEAMMTGDVDSLADVEGLFHQQACNADHHAAASSAQPKRKKEPSPVGTAVGAPRQEPKRRGGVAPETGETVQLPPSLAQSILDGNQREAMEIDCQRELGAARVASLSSGRPGNSSAVTQPPGDANVMMPPPPEPPAKRQEVTASAVEAASPPREAATRRRTRVDCAVDDAADVGSMQRAFLSQLEEDGSTSCVAVGEYRVEDGVFAVEFVSPDHEDIDLAGARLGDMLGGVVALDDLEDANLELDCEEADNEDDGMDVEMPTPCGPVPSSSTASSAPQNGSSAAGTQTDTTTCSAETQTEYSGAQLLGNPAGYAPADIRIREMTPSGGAGKLVSLNVWLTNCKREGHQRPPILTLWDRAAQQSAGAWQAHFAAKSQQLEAAKDELDAALNAQAKLVEGHAQETADLQAEIARLHEQHAQELALLREQHAQEVEAVRSAAKAEGQRVRDEWCRIRERQQRLQHEMVQQDQQKRHESELAAKDKRTTTWRMKRHNQLRSHTRELARVRAAEAKANEKAAEMRQLAAEKEAEIEDLLADNDALNAEVGARVKVADQREHRGSRTAFTLTTILRDLRVRQSSLNSGAGNIRDVTAVYSSMIAADMKCRAKGWRRRSALA